MTLAQASLEEETVGTTIPEEVRLHGDEIYSFNIYQIYPP